MKIPMSDIEQLMRDMESKINDLRKNRDQWRLAFQHLHRVSHVLADLGLKPIDLMSREDYRFMQELYEDAKEGETS